MSSVSFEVTNNLSSSKGWGRYKVTSLVGKPIIVSRTGNEWVSADHAGEVEGEFTVTLQTMKRIGPRKREEITTDTYRMRVAEGATCQLGYTSHNSLGVLVIGAEKA